MGATGAEWRRWNRWSVKASLPCSCFPPTDDRGVVLQTESVSAHVLLLNVPQDNIFQDMQTCISSQMSESCDANANVREIQVTTIYRYFFGLPNIFWRIVKYFLSCSRSDRGAHHHDPGAPQERGHGDQDPHQERLRGLAAGASSSAARPADAGEELRHREDQVPVTQRQTFLQMLHLRDRTHQIPLLQETASQKSNI